jgi:CubicO group peptidase (beta-lactamase class C family)
MNKPTLILLLFLSSLLAVGKTAAELPTVNPAEVGLSGQALSRVDAKMEELIKDEKLAGGIVVIARKGKIAHFKPYGLRDKEAKLSMEKDTIFRIYSMTKAITSVAALMLHEEGKLGLDDPLSKFFPTLKDLKVHTKDGLVALKREPTVSDLMRHTAGLTYGKTKISAVDQAFKQAKMLDRNLAIKPMMSGMSSVPLVFQPGTDWRYGCATDVLGGVIEVASGQKLDTFFQERIFKPLGMKDTGFFVPKDKVERFAVNYNYKDERLSVKDATKTSKYLENPTFLSGGGGLCSTADDYARFLLMVSNGGKLGKERLLKKKTVRLMTTDQVPKGGGWVTFGEQIREGVGFGLGFSVRVKMSDWDPDGRVGEYGWGGAASTHYWISPKDDLVVLTLEQVMPYSFNTEFAIKGLIYDALED